MKCVRNRLFTVDGMIEDEGKIQQMILDEVMTCQSIGIAKKVKSLFDTVKLMAYSEPLPIETDRIPPEIIKAYTHRSTQKHDINR